MTTPRLQVGVDRSNYGDCPFLNVYRHNDAGQCTLTVTISGSSVNVSGADLMDANPNGTGNYFDANGELNDITGATKFQKYVISAVIVNPLAPSQKYPEFTGRKYTLKWDNGEAVTATSLAWATRDTQDLTAKVATFTFGDFNGQSRTIYVQFNLNPSLGAGPTNIRLVETSKLTGFENGDLLDPDWLDFHSGVSDIARFMDPLFTNSSPVVDYADIATVDNAHYGTTQTAGKPVLTNGLKAGWPLAAPVEYINRTGKSAWINIPHKATDDCITSIATYYRDNIDWVSNPDALLCVEYSNEDWNSSFDQFDWLTDQAAAANWIGYETAGMDYTPGEAQFAGYRAAQVMEIFRTVFGTDSGTKWVGMLCTQTNNPNISTSKIQGVNWHLNADSGDNAPAGTTITDLFSYLCVTTYFAPSITTLSSGAGKDISDWLALGQEVFNQNYYDALTNSDADSDWWGINRVLARIASHKTIADAAGLLLGAYEGGFSGQVALASIRDDPDTGPPLNAAIGNCAESWQIAQFHRDLFDAALDAGLVFASKYTATGPHNKFGSWGMRRTRDDLSECSNALEAWRLQRPWTKHCRTFRTQASA